MKSDLDALMQSHDLSALLMTGSGQHNPPMVYMTGGAHMTAELIKPRGADPVIFCRGMERDEAARTGLPTRELEAYSMPEYLSQANGDSALAQAMRYRQMLLDLGVTSGRVSVYGQTDAGRSLALFSALQRLMPEVTLVGEVDASVLMRARATKDKSEVERIRQMGAVTTSVVARTAEFLTSQRVSDGVLVDADGKPWTVGQVKSKINFWLAEQGAETPEGFIFAIGRDAGVPHSSGISSDLLRLGQTIVFDIYPCEMGGGYFYDFTRTWCLGYATDEALALYEDVRQVYDQVMQALSVETPFGDYQKLTCDLFEQRGHPTIQSQPRTQSGYVHSLGHGIGLNIHEEPFSRTAQVEPSPLLPGHVITIEPGLYYPERGMGVRLEDSVYVRPDGKFEILAEYPLDLVLPIKA